MAERRMFAKNVIDSDMFLEMPITSQQRQCHFDSYSNNTPAYYKAQERIAEIIKRGDYLSYGKRQAIIYDCQLGQALEENAEYQALSRFEQLLREQECKRVV